MLQDLLLPLGLPLIAFAIYKWFTRNKDYFKKRGIPFVEPYFFVGNTGNFWFKRQTVPDFLKSLYDSLPNEKIFGAFDFSKPFFFIRDPETIKQLAIKDFDHFADHRSFIDEKSDDLFANSLFMLRGEKWRHMRATLSPAFTGSKMRQMFELVTETADDMATYFKKQANKDAKGSVDCEMKEIFSKYSNDVIASAAFGVKVNSFEDDKNDFFVTGKKFMSFGGAIGVIKVLIIRIMPAVARQLNIEFIASDVSSFFKKMVLGNMEAREKQNIFRPDMINILMQVKKGNAISVDQQESTKDKDSAGFATVEESSIGKAVISRNWTDNEIVAQCFLFFAAGFDTSSTLLAFAVHELTVNPDIQQRLYEEVLAMNEKLDGKRISYDVLQQMTYLDMVISETLRLWPPAAFTDRKCVKDYNYDDGKLKFKIEKESSFWIPMSALHHDSQYFPNPKKFDPERFSEENKNSILPGTYVPFGVGPRNCIGSRFALMEAKAIIYYLVLNFKFEPNEKTQIPIKLKKSPFGMATEHGANVSFKLR